MRRSVLVTVVSATVLLLPVGPAAASNQHLWTRTHDGGSNSTGGVGVAVDPGNGNVYVLTDADCCPFDTADTVAYSSTGTTLWTVNSGDPTDDDPVAITVDPASHDVIITGERGNGMLLTEAYSAAGALLWTRVRAVDNRHLVPVGIATDGHGRVVVAASTSTSTGPEHYLTIAYQISTGERLWYSNYGAPNGYADPVGIAADPAKQQVYVTGKSSGLNDPELTTVAYDTTTGNQTWVARDTGGNDTGPVAVVVDTSNHHVYAETDAMTNGFEFSTFAYSSSGALLWNKNYQPSNGNNASPTAMTVDPSNGQVYVVGYQESNSDASKTVLVAYSSSGTSPWVDVRSTSDDHDFARAVTADPADHRVYVASDRTPPGGRLIMVTTAYDSAGGEDWHEPQASPNPGGVAGPTSITVDPGRAQVYTTGTQTIANNAYPVAVTVAYKA